MAIDDKKHCGTGGQTALSILITAVVLISRAILIVHAHSPTRDENAHLYRGLLILRHDSALIHSPSTVWNDPPLGETLLAIPAYLNGAQLADPLAGRDMSRPVPTPLKYQYVMSDTIRYETGIWVSLLLLPGFAVIFCWVRSVYSAASAWLTLALLLVEPTLAAHAPLLTLDVLGMDAIVIACWLAWRYFESPNLSRLALVSVATAVALAVKNTALVLPAVLGIYAVIQWIIFPLKQGRPVEWRGHLRDVIVFALTAAVALWVFTIFDFSRPDVAPHRFANPVLEFLDKLPLPAGLYLRAVVSGIGHARSGHSAILLGQLSTTGWWYYFPVVATYKIPFGMAVVLVIGLASLTWVKPRYAELPILIPALVWTLSLMRQHIDIGFRHFLTPEVFWIMLVSRCVVVRRPVVSTLVWTATALAGFEVALFTPDYLSYVNFPRRQVWLQINDSNIDWGQGNKELRRWIDGLPDDGKPIYVGYFGPMNQDLFPILGPRLTQYVMNGGTWISRTPGTSMTDTGLPSHGILIVSPILVTAQYDPVQRFACLRHIPPKEIIGHSLLVYDLDELHLPNRRSSAPATRTENADDPG